jgi:hypothetical protein
MEEGRRDNVRRLRLRRALGDENVYCGVAAIQRFGEVRSGVVVVNIPRRDRYVVAAGHWPDPEWPSSLAEVARRAVKDEKELRASKAPTALEGVQTKIVYGDAIDRLAC